MPHRRITRHVKAYTRRHLGRRGTILAALGTLWIVTGAVTLVAPDPAAAYPLLAYVTPLRGVVWIVTGAVAVVYAHARQGHDAPGWGALYLMAGYRVIAYGHGLILHILGHPDGTLRSAFGLASWVALLVVIRVCSGWREHHDDPLHTGQIDTIHKG